MLLLMEFNLSDVCLVRIPVCIVLFLLITALPVMQAIYSIINVYNNVLLLTTRTHNNIDAHPANNPALNVSTRTPAQNARTQPNYICTKAHASPHAHRPHTRMTNRIHAFDVVHHVKCAYQRGPVSPVPAPSSSYIRINVY